MIDFLTKVVLASLLGMLIGYNREELNKPAGVRTNALVSMGAAIFTYISTTMPTPSRIAANIIVGIGFIGAGTIFKTSDRVIGLTTAAALWISASVGMLVGYGLYAEGIVSSILCFLILEYVSMKKVRPRKK